MKKVVTFIMLCITSVTYIMGNENIQDTLSVTQRLNGMVFNHRVVTNTDTNTIDTLTLKKIKNLNTPSDAYNEFNIEFIKEKYTFPKQLYIINSITKRTDTKYEIWVTNSKNNSNFLIISANNNDSKKHKCELKVGNKYQLTLRTIYPNPEPIFDLEQDTVFAKSLSLKGQSQIKAPVVTNCVWRLPDSELYDIEQGIIYPAWLAWNIFEILELKDDYYIAE